MAKLKRAKGDGEGKEGGNDGDSSEDSPWRRQVCFVRFNRVWDVTIATFGVRDNGRDPCDKSTTYLTQHQ